LAMKWVKLNELEGWNRSFDSYHEGARFMDGEESTAARARRAPDRQRDVLQTGEGGFGAGLQVRCDASRSHVNRPCTEPRCAPRHWPSSLLVLRHRPSPLLVFLFVAATVSQYSPRGPRPCPLTGTHAQTGTGDWLCGLPLPAVMASQSCRSPATSHTAIDRLVEDGVSDPRAFLDACSPRTLSLDH
jgi:hypothetical protein